MIFLYPKCHRDRTDCEPIHCITGVSEQPTQEEIETLSFTPASFVCSGKIREGNTVIDQDIYRLCFKNEVGDEMTDNDMQDLTSVMSVCSAAMNLDAIRKVQNGIVEIPAENNRVKED